MMEENKMEEIHALLTCFGERYIYCDNEQAEFDFKVNRENMSMTYNAILHFAELLETENKKPL